MEAWTATLLAARFSEYPLPVRKSEVLSNFSDFFHLFRAFTDFAV